MLTQSSEAGFFGWKDSYEPDALLDDAGTTTLHVALLSESKGVPGYFNGMPPEFHQLVRTLGIGAEVVRTNCCGAWREAVGIQPARPGRKILFHYADPLRLGQARLVYASP